MNDLVYLDKYKGIDIKIRVIQMNKSKYGVNNDN